MERTFANPSEFALFLERAAKYEKFADDGGRAQTAIFVTQAVKERIGDPEMLPPPLAESTVEDRGRQGFSADETLLRTGELRDSYHWEHVSARKTRIGSDSNKALWHELGVDDAGRNHSTVIPGRYPLTRTITENEEQAFEKYLEAFFSLFTPK